VIVLPIPTKRRPRGLYHGLSLYQLECEYQSRGTVISAPLRPQGPYELPCNPIDLAEIEENLKKLEGGLDNFDSEKGVDSDTAFFQCNNIDLQNIHALKK